MCRVGPQDLTFPVTATTRSDVVEPGRARQVLYVVGSGRSGTSTLCGILKALGVPVPQPEMPPNNTNPRGFGEPAWVVKRHQRWLSKAAVHVSDARPAAWSLTSDAVEGPEKVQACADWLATRFDVDGDTLLVKDPRLIWFHDLWSEAARRSGAQAAYLIMLRPPTEVVASKQAYYSEHGGASGLVAAWLNVMLRAEHRTRSERRRFIRYEDLLRDWRTPIFGAAAALHLSQVSAAPAQAQARADEFLDPTLRRVQATWEDLPVPATLRELAERTWEALVELSREHGDHAGAQAALDRLRAEYQRYYAEVEAVAESSIRAAHREGFREGRAQTAAPFAPPAETTLGAEAPGPTRVVARLASRFSRRR